MTDETGTKSKQQSPIQRAARLSVWLLGVALASCSQTSRIEARADERAQSWELGALSHFHARDSEVLRRLALANVLTRTLTAESVNHGAISDEELASWTAFHWTQVDRPEVFRTSHAVVRVKADATSAELEKAERVAGLIRLAVAESTTAEAFKTNAAAVDTQGLEVKVEALDFVAADGRVMRLGAKVNAQGGAYDPAFAKAAAALSSVGQVSPVTRSSFGFHVIRLEETLPPLRLDEKARRALAQKDVVDRRVRLALQAVLENERQRVDPSVERSSEEATAKVSVE